MQWQVAEKFNDLLENLIFQQCVEMEIEEWRGNTDGDTVGEVLKCKIRIQINTEMQVHRRANTFTSTAELPVSSGLKRSKLS